MRAIMKILSFKYHDTKSQRNAPIGTLTKGEVMQSTRLPPAHDLGKLKHADFFYMQSDCHPISNTQVADEQYY